MPKEDERKKEYQEHDKKNPFCKMNQYFDGELGTACTCGISPTEYERPE